MEQFTVVLDQLIGFAIMLVIGYICVRCKVYGEKALEGICQLILKVGIPLMVFSNATAGATRADLFESGIILVFQAVMYVLLISSTWLIAKVMRLPVDRGHIFQAAFIFGNVGFIGLPLLIALFPERGALFYSLMALLDQFLMWTYGVWLTRSEQTRRERPAASLAQQLRGLLSPGLVSVIVSLLVILIGIPIPEDINTPLHTVGSISTPLSLMYIGGLFALRDWKTTLKQPEVYVGIVVIALFPERGALFYSLMALLDQFLMWTYGVWLTRSEQTRRERPAASLAQQLRGLLSPGLVSVIVSLLVILIGIPIPEDINTPLHTVGSISTPLSLMYIGGLFALRDWKTTLKQPEVYVGIVVKMLIIPIVLFALLTFVPPMLGLGAMNADMVHAVTVVCAMPTMAALVMFAERERNMPEYAVGLVLVTTAASLLTLTGVSYVVF